MRSILLLPLLILSALPLAAIPSQKDALASAKRDAQGVYNIASRTKDQAKFLETIIRLQEVGAKISAANQQALGSIRPGYPADVKSKQAQQPWDRKFGDSRRSLDDADREIRAFIPPAEMTPAGLRAVDAFIRTLDKAIEAHHNACLNIR